MTVTTDAKGVADHVDVWDERVDNIVTVSDGLAVVPEIGDVVKGRPIKIDVGLVRLVTLVEGV